MENREIEAIVRDVLKEMNQGQSQKATPADHGSVHARPESAQSWLGNAQAGESGAKAADAVAERQVCANGGLVHASMPLATAVGLIQRIETKAAEWDMRVVAAVSDAAGRPVAIHCMDGAYIGSFDVALNKTYTSIAFQMSTAQLGELCRPDKSLYGLQFTNQGRIVIFGGGELLRQKGVIVGALGVSGGSAEQDTALAAYGKRIFEEVETCL